jgi:hypothetical protein
MPLTTSDLNLPNIRDIDNIVFVRIPKTASESILYLRDTKHTPYIDGGKIVDVTRADDIVIGEDDSKYNIMWKPSSINNTPSDKVPHEDFEGWKAWRDKGSFSFTVIRNPFDLICSKFCWFLKLYKSTRGRSGSVYIDEHFKKIDFDEYVKQCCNSNVKMNPIEAPDSGTQIGYGQRMSRSLFYQAFNEEGSCEVDVILKYEKINEAVKNVFGDYLGIKVDEFPKLNVSKKKKEDYREYYTDETRRLVEEYYKTDLQVFGYDFDGSTDDEIIIDPKNVSIPPFDLRKIHERRLEGLKILPLNWRVWPPGVRKKRTPQIKIVNGRTIIDV